MGDELLCDAGALVNHSCWRHSCWRHSLTSLRIMQVGVHGVQGYHVPAKDDEVFFQGDGQCLFADVPELHQGELPSSLPVVDGSYCLVISGFQVGESAVVFL